TVAGCRLDDLAAEFGTPVLVVDEDALRSRAREYLAAFRDRWPRSEVAFASKAFPCTAIQRLMSEEGLHLVQAGLSTLEEVLRVTHTETQEEIRAERAGVPPDAPVPAESAAEAAAT
ncbi:MAG TPA: hypothetical protein PLC79_04275, partial [Phycisphaerae bacterium]|nr:hypothetical protein [Phycisphaerae bacterium]